MSKTPDLAARRMQAVPRGVANATAFFIERAENAEIWDADGRRLIDFASGIAVLNTGHRHPKIVAAVAAQLERYTHAAFQVTAYEPYIELAERLNAVVPVRGPAKTILFTTGAEAVENAVKIARAATQRPAVIAFSGAFHGRTLYALSLTGKAVPYKHGMGPLPGEVYRVPFPVPHFGIDTAHSLAAIESLFKTDVTPDRVAAIILEPIQGEGGFHPAPSDLLIALREICDRNGIVLILDEIQSGFARTGKLFALQHHELQGDLLVTAKSLAGGLPLSGVTGTAALMDALPPGGLGGTYAGSPLACAAALAVLDVIAAENLCERAAALGGRARARLESLSRQAELMPIGNIRGLGAMLAFDVVNAPGSAQVIAGAGAALSKRAHERGLVLLSCGMYSEAVRLLFPLTAAETLIDEGLNLLADALLRT